MCLSFFSLPVSLSFSLAVSLSLFLSLFLSLPKIDLGIEDVIGDFCGSTYREAHVMSLRLTELLLLLT